MTLLLDVLITSGVTVPPLLWVLAGARRWQCRDEYEPQVVQPSGVTVLGPMRPYDYERTGL